MAALERPAFHATRLVRAGRGVVVYEPGADEVTRVDVGPTALEPRAVHPSVPVEGEVAVAENGRTLALFTRRRSPPQVVFVDLEGGAERTISVPGGTPRLAFRGTDLLVYDGGGSYRVTPTGDVLRLPETPFERSLLASAGDMRLAGIGTWLYAEGETGLYLGHEMLRGGDYRLSPDGTRVARIADGRVLLDTLEVRDAAAAAFVSDALLAVATIHGALLLVDTTTGEIKDEIDMGAPARDIDAGTRQALVRVFTQQRNLTQVYAVREGRFRGPYVVGDAAVSSGLLDAGSPDEPVLWTIAGGGLFRRYTLAELEAGIPLAKIDATGDPDRVANAIPDRQGRRYSTSWNGRAYVLTRVGGPSVELAGATTFVVPSPRGDVVLASLGTGGMAAYRTDTLERLWTIPAVRQGAVFAAAAPRALLTSAGGALLVDTSTGEVVDRVCGPVFTARRSLPPNWTLTGNPGMCEQ